MTCGHDLLVLPVITGILGDLSPEKALPRAIPHLLGGQIPDRILCLGKAGHPLARCASALLPRCPGFLYDAGSWGPAPPGWAMRQGTHPLPTPENETATREALEWCRRGSGSLLVLISGGASSLLVDPVPPWNLGEKADTCAALLASGAPIEEINAVRMRLSAVKGGGFRRRCGASRVFTGVWCDVPPPSWRLVGSAPTLAVRTLPRAEHVVQKYAIALPRALPEDRILRRSPSGDRALRLCHEGVLRANLLRALMRSGFRADPLPLPEGIPAESAAALFREAAESVPAGACAAFVATGEVSVARARGGRGGRCSHLAALVSLELANSRGWEFVALATDGVDGSGDAGARVSAATVPPPGEIRKALEARDTATLWSRHSAAIPRNPTGNNLRDLYVLVVRR